MLAVLMQVGELSLSEWEIVSRELGFEDIFSQRTFISTYSHCYQLKARYYIVRDSSKNYMLLACFSKANSIVIPNYFMFNSIWVNGDLSEVSKNEVLRVLINFLKSNFKNITLRLPVDFQDIRPFLWQQFDPTLKYTYIKKLAELDYHENIRRILHKENTRYRFEMACWNEEIEERLIPELLHIQFRRSAVDAVISSFKQLCQSGEMLIFAGYEGKTLVAFDIVLEDKSGSKAYMFFISKSYHHYKSGFPTLLYDFVFKKLRDKGIKEVDLYGANIPEIALFKSKFNPQLRSFYELRYSRNRVLLRNLKSGAKRLMKSVLNS